MDITPVELERLAVLTRLALTEEEKASLSGQLGDVLGYVQRLAKVDTQGIPETDAVIKGFTGRKDEPATAM
jgi:aspartyl-tRNA(Asn)/glutamyl-tRNA(Gln) amidotransferase subunit C